ncbi:hypothetical protein R2R35_18350 [Anaerocolumna sp. AGMB13020]|uniref:hypothetical protein n=1 Tax=Anaerocolumna sp. AGMB13020 TaxID=3081750 RepID=UPI002953C1FA|nr:hypothetical protein [Anaerocolumna sp. AGMB13020]WOO35742.1 hypothetical protein R2R35_18350 [Anaerocolumna sp. AGMB13020]
MKKFYKFTALLLIVAIFCVSLQNNAYAKTNNYVRSTIGNEKLQRYSPERPTMTIYNDEQIAKNEVYVDGKKVNISMDANNTLALTVNDKDFNAVMEIYADGAAGLIVDNGKEQHDYVLQINELITDTGKVDINVFEDNTMVESYSSLSDVRSYTYTGQIPIFAGWAIAEIIGFCISALIVAGVITTIQSVATQYGYDWYDGKEAYKVIAAEPELKKYYYPALITNTVTKKVAMGVTKNYTYIAVYAGMDLNSASALATVDKPIDVYTYSASNAAKVITNAGFKTEKVDIEKHTSSGLQFPHFHKAGHSAGLSDFHSLCGTPTLYN